MRPSVGSKRPISMGVCGVGVLMVVSIACHDAPRNNPFDPALTPPVELVSAVVDTASGTATLEWTPYAGQQPFAAYWVMRKVRGLEAVDTLEVIEDVHRTTFRDTTPEPDIEYMYWITVVNQGRFAVSGEKREASYELPGVELLRADLSSETATAQLTWTAYRGPAFEAYEVRRQAGGFGERTVAELEDIADTTYTNLFLDGNTDYGYRIYVRTTWKDVRVFSNEHRGRFYPFLEERPLPISGLARVQAVGLALDERDGLYIAMTTILTTTARLMREGILVAFPGESIRFSPYFEDVLPDRRSPIPIAAGRGAVYVSLTAEDEGTFVAALGEDGEVWRSPVDNKGAFPVGLHLEEDGDLLMVDAQGRLYRFSADGLPKEQDERLQRSLDPEALPLRQVVVEPGAGLGGHDQFFLLAPERSDYHVLVRTWLGILFAESPPLDEGVGLENGQTLNPVALAFDRQRSRLLVLEAQGRLQVFDARPEDVPHRYITKWGGFGSGKGEFLVSLPISVAMVVDSEGMIYVADGARRIQVFAP